MQRLSPLKHLYVFGDPGRARFGALEVADAERHRESVLSRLRHECRGDLRLGIQCSLYPLAPTPLGATDDSERGQGQYISGFGPERSKVCALTG